MGASEADIVDVVEGFMTDPDRRRIGTSLRKGQLTLFEIFAWPVMVVVVVLLLRSFSVVFIIFAAGCMAGVVARDCRTGEGRTMVRCLL